VHSTQIYTETNSTLVHFSFGKRSLEFALDLH